ncbi:hypothetical protein NCS52_00459600 [Fusarium sp. LHS14.1]|nr:hypothetical protein NCS52_00459600 [Fusarium sp. LHS14.1]
MTIRFLVNFGLLALPIAITLGILFGLEKHREATGGPPLFKPQPDPTKPKTPNNNGITVEQYCQKSYGIHPETKGQEFTLNPNQWGVKDGGKGGMCLYVDVHNNKTYDTEFTAPNWASVWAYPIDDVTAPVHAFPNVMVESDSFPAKLNTIEKIEIDFAWTYAPGNTSAKGSKYITKSDFDDLVDREVNANVAMDMFLDKDKDKSAVSEDASHEIMVWFAAIGAATQPIGFNGGTSPVATKTLNGVKFELYVGVNDETKQKVLTWYVKDPVEKFSGDLSPLVNEILSMDDSDYPSPTDYLGYMAWGTEAYSSDNKYVTFNVTKLAIDVETTSSS